MEYSQIMDALNYIRVKQLNSQKKKIYIYIYTKIGKDLLLFVEEGATVDDDYSFKMLKKHFYVIRR